MYPKHPELFDENFKEKSMSVFEDIDQIIDYAHFWNWAPDWNVVKEIYQKVPDSYSVLMPFAYAYLEEMIRTTTSDYGLPLFDRDKKPVKVTVSPFQILQCCFWVSQA